MINNYESLLDNTGEAEWLAAVERVAPAMHEVDRDAAQIWFRFYPLALFRFLENSENKVKDAQRFVIQGEYELHNQIDSSHAFLYGHRFWSETKAAIANRAASFNDESGDLAKEIEAVAQTVTDQLKVDKSLTLGIAAVGLMTLTQVGLDAFKAADGVVEKPRGILAKSPDTIVAERAKDDSQGVFGFLRTVNKKYTVNWQNSKSVGSYRITNDEDVATASSHDRSEEWKKQDERCWEGVVPVECRSAACGTCWVGVVGGAEKLSDVARLERKQMKIFGFNQPDEAKPFLRLACQAKTSGNVSIVIPPWNGVFGKKVYDNIEHLELEPVTTSAAKLRETIANAVSEE